MPEEIENGCLGLGEKTTDYILTEGILDALPTLYPQDEIIFQYNQGKQKWSKKSCTLFSPIGAVSDLMNIQIGMDRAEEWDKDSYNHGRREGEGRRVQLGVDHICKKYNESDLAKEHGKVAYYSIDLKNNTLVKKVLDKRYTICTGYDGNSKYNNDIDDNGVLNGVEFGKRTYGHAVNAIWGINTPSRIKDNYYGTAKYNIYGVEHEFSEIPCFFNKGYVFTKVREDNLEEIKRLNEFKSALITSIEYNSMLWHLTNDEAYKNKLHEMNEINRRKVQDCDEQLKKYI